MKNLQNWYGLRCAAQQCPCVPADGGWTCVICGKREFWTDAMRAHYAFIPPTPGSTKET